MAEPASPPPDTRSPLERYVSGMAQRMDSQAGRTQPAPDPSAPPPEEAAEPTPPTPDPETVEAGTAPAVETEEVPEPEPEAGEPEPGEASEAEAADESPDETVYVVRVNGEDHEVPASELIAGYQRQSDYTQKTQALAAERRQHETTTEQFAKQQQKIAQHWEQTGHQILAEVRGLSEQDWSQLQREDPDQFREIQASIQARQQLGQQVLQRAEQERAEALQRSLPIEKAKLVERLNASRIPIAGKPGDWSDPQQFNQGYQALTEWAVGTAGIAPERWNRTVDHLEVWIVAQAMARDLETRERPVIRERVKEKVKRVAKPAPPPSQPAGPEAAVQKRRDAFAQNPGDGRLRHGVLKDILRQRGAFSQKGPAG